MALFLKLSVSYTKPLIFGFSALKAVSVGCQNSLITLQGSLVVGIHLWPINNIPPAFTAVKLVSCTYLTPIRLQERHCKATKNS
jgi:hypothetical protein